MQANRQIDRQCQMDYPRVRDISRFGIVILAGLFFIVMIGTACQTQPVIGDLSTSGSLSLIRFEALDNGVTGVVYRTVNDFEKLVARSRVPVLVAFYQPQDEGNSLVIPCLEQMADDYQDRIQIVWINARVHKAIAASFSVEQYPHFTAVVDASLKQAVVGFDEQGCVRLRELVDRYVLKDS